MTKKKAPLKELVKVGLEYLAVRAEASRIAAVMKKLNEFLKEELSGLPAEELLVGDEILYLSHPESKSFDLEGAKKKLSPEELAKLEPFIKTTESFELKAAEGLLDFTRLQKFIEVRESVSLCVKANKEAA